MLDVIPPLLATARAVADLCHDARKHHLLAIDTEADSFHSYHHKLCLIQITFSGVHALIDPLAVDRDGLQPLADLLADPNITVLMHGADYDVRVLDRDLGARISGLRDTQVAAQLLGEEHTGLAALLQTHLGVVLDKRFQRADWSQRPLAADLLRYAVNDTAHLAALTAVLEAHLRSRGRVEWWYEECEALESIRWEPNPVDPLAFDRLKGASRLQGADRDRLAALFHWRDQAAQSRDAAPFRIVRNEILLAVAAAAPTTPAELADVPGVSPGVIRRWGRELLRVLETVTPAPPRPVRPRLEVDRQREERLRALREIRDRLATELSLQPGVLAPRAALEAVVDEAPRSLPALAGCLQRRWRAAVLAPVLLPVVASWPRDTGRADGPVS